LLNGHVFFEFINPISAAGEKEFSARLKTPALDFNEKAEICGAFGVFYIKIESAKIRRI